MARLGTVHIGRRTLDVNGFTGTVKTSETGTSTYTPNEPMHAPMNSGPVNPVNPEGRFAVTSNTYGLTVESLEDPTKTMQVLGESMTDGLRPGSVVTLLWGADGGVDRNAWLGVLDHETGVLFFSETGVHDAAYSVPLRFLGYGAAVPGCIGIASGIGILYLVWPGLIGLTLLNVARKREVKPAVQEVVDRFKDPLKGGVKSEARHPVQGTAGEGS